MEFVSSEKVSTLNTIASALKDVPGEVAVILGGSQAAGYAHEQ